MTDTKHTREQEDAIDALACTLDDVMAEEGYSGARVEAMKRLGLWNAPDGKQPLIQADEIDRLQAINAELLAALKEVVSEYEEGYGLNCIEQVTTAITKAKGETS